MSQMLVALVILLVTVALFIFEPIPLMVSAIAASILYAFFGLIEIKDIFASYATNTNVLMVAMMIIGASMFHSGLSELIGMNMAKYIKGSEKRAILVTMLASCALSSVCTNIGVMTALAPLCTAMCLSSGIAPSKVLLSLLFGAQLGGFNTLVGVPSNVLANSLMMGAGYESFGLFSITPFGVTCCIAGALYFAFIGSKLIRDTGYIPEFAQTDRKPLDKRKATITVITLFLVTTVIFFAIAILTQFISNTAAILLFMPIAISVAKLIGVNVQPVAMIITLAGAAAFSEGVRKVVLTHAEHPAIDYTVSQQKAAVSQAIRTARRSIF